jgi:hypothetical protein
MFKERNGSYNYSQNLELFEVCNDMMQPTIQIASRIIGKNVDNATFFEWGEIYILVIDGLNHQCRLLPSEKAGFYKVKYDNESYPVNYISKDIVSGIYRGIGLMTFL